MLAFLNNIRCAEKKFPLKRQIINTATKALLGVTLGAFSKFLDTIPANHLPALLQYLDVRNFLGRVAIWIFIAACISIYSMSPIRAAAPAVTVCIHQNSYPEEYVSGAQVFYYKDSDPGQRIAECIQKSLAERIGEENVRQSKANDSYYLLKKTGIPIIIVECGFLSNAAEAEKLSDGTYQENSRGRFILEFCDI